MPPHVPHEPFAQVPPAVAPTVGQVPPAGVHTIIELPVELGTQQPPPAQVLFAQQGWPAPPQTAQTAGPLELLFVQMVSALRQRLPASSTPGGQQASPRPPQPVQREARQAPNSVPWYVHFCSGGTHRDWTQQPPPAHLLAPAQQGSPAPPQ